MRVLSTRLRAGRREAGEIVQTGTWPHGASQPGSVTPAGTAAPDGNAAATRLEVRRISHYFRVDGDWMPILDGVDLTAASGELVSVIGPSGCGKSTLLNILAGLLKPAAGEVLIDGKPVGNSLGLAGYMPQKDLLLPWKRALDNTIVPLELQGVPRSQAREEARALFPRFGLEGFERHYPATLSGGMRQRAALLRTFLSRRDILLLDEPFGALDALTRMQMQDWLLDVWGSFRKTIVLVTHDVEEAIYLADRVYVMSPRPGRTVKVLEVPIARPRRHVETVTSDAFAAMKRELLEVLMGLHGGA